MEEFRAASQKLGDGVGVKSLMQSTGLGMIADQHQTLQLYDRLSLTVSQLFILRKELELFGLGALWTGIGPNIARSAIINAAELASYDQVKQLAVGMLIR
ncbi:hypothetical protein Ahy_B05g073849 isoform A [Arachis hypogaea]|uniref:Uncharacterized protein n=1 Tax=Arachis hypogaea TaxID=3818 RepID=A0A444YX99_ARAHY|nr:hypothetical protein Ahy_B05g073849 isoform A [Arachis hypogaea]